MYDGQFMQGFLLAAGGRNGENIDIEHEFYGENMLDFFFYIAYNSYRDILFNQIV